jgi:hypothetical protein
MKVIENWFALARGFRQNRSQMTNRQLRFWSDVTTEVDNEKYMPTQETPLRAKANTSQEQHETQVAIRQLFTNPERQIGFDKVPHYEWPKPLHDRDTITVDRIRNDIDGPAHRFVIKRHDYVEVFFSKGAVDYGHVVGYRLHLSRDRTDGGKAEQTSITRRRNQGTRFNKRHRRSSQTRDSNTKSVYIDQNCIRGSRWFTARATKNHQHRRRDPVLQAILDGQSR